MQVYFVEFCRTVLKALRNKYSVNIKYSASIQYTLDSFHYSSVQNGGRVGDMLHDLNAKKF